MNRRTALAGAGVVGLSTLSGCLGLVDRFLEHEASPVTVPEAVRSQTGYGRTAVEPMTVEESGGVGPLSATVRVTNYLTEHEKAVEVGPIGRARAAVFVALSTPAVSIGGRTLNPVERMNTRELVGLVQDNYDDLDVDGVAVEEAVTILGQSTTQARYDGRANFNGVPLDVSLHVSEAVEAGDDLVVTIGVYPAQLRSREESHVVSMMEAVERAAADEFDDEE